LKLEWFRGSAPLEPFNTDPSTYSDHVKAEEFEVANQEAKEAKGKLNNVAY
jgi:hypothetical protein